MPCQTRSRGRSHQLVGTATYSRTAAGHLTAKRLLTPDEVLRLNPILCCSNSRDAGRFWPPSCATTAHRASVDVILRCLPPKRGKRPTGPKVQALRNPNHDVTA